MTMTSLSDCPCCGPKKDFDRPMLLKDDFNFSYIQCPLCDIRTESYYEEEKTLGVWNTRAPTAGELHWKSNHDCQVAKAKILIDRPDMPLERVKAYAQIGELQEKIRRLEERLRE